MFPIIFQEIARLQIIIFFVLTIINIALTFTLNIMKTITGTYYNYFYPISQKSWWWYGIYNNMIQ